MSKAEDRDRAIELALRLRSLPSPSAEHIDAIVLFLKEAEERGRLKENERCCKALCYYCRTNRKPYQEGDKWFHGLGVDDEGNQYRALCRADEIRGQLEVK